MQPHLCIVLLSLGAFDAVGGGEMGPVLEPSAMLSLSNRQRMMRLNGNGPLYTWTSAGVEAVGPFMADEGQPPVVPGRMITPDELAILAHAGFREDDAVEFGFIEFADTALVQGEGSLNDQYVWTSEGADGVRSFMYEGEPPVVAGRIITQEELATLAHAGFNVDDAMIAGYVDFASPSLAQTNYHPGHNDPAPQPHSHHNDPHPEPQPHSYHPRPEPQPQPHPEPQPHGYHPRPEPQPEPHGYHPRPEPQPEPHGYHPRPEPRPEPYGYPRPEPAPWDYSSTGPSSTGPSSTGPSSTGPSSTGPSWGPGPGYDNDYFHPDDDRFFPQPEPRPEPYYPRPEPRPHDYHPRPEPQPEPHGYHPRPEPQPHGHHGHPEPAPTPTPRPYNYHR